MRSTSTKADSTGSIVIVMEYDPDAFPYGYSGGALEVAAVIVNNGHHQGVSSYAVALHRNVVFVIVNTGGFPIEARGKGASVVVVTVQKRPVFVRTVLLSSYPVFPKSRQSGRSAPPCRPRRWSTSWDPTAG